MESKSFLLSFFDIYKQLCINEATLLSNSIKVNYCLSYNKDRDHNLNIEFDQIKGFYQFATEIVTVQSLLLNVKQGYLDLPLSIANLYIQELIKTSVKYSTIKNGKLLYLTANREVTVELPSREVIETLYNKLLFCGLLSEGYIIKEVKGSHFVFISDSLVQNMVTSYNCTCDVFGLYRDCEHLRSSKTILLNRGLVKQVIKIMED